MVGCPPSTSNNLQTLHPCSRGGHRTITLASHKVNHRMVILLLVSNKADHQANILLLASNKVDPLASILRVNNGYLMPKGLLPETKHSPVNQDITSQTLDHGPVHQLNSHSNNLCTSNHSLDADPAQVLAGRPAHHSLQHRYHHVTKPRHRGRDRLQTKYKRSRRWDSRAPSWKKRSV